VYFAVRTEELIKLLKLFFFSFPKVTTLVNTSNKGPSGKKKGRSKKAHVLAASVEQATQNFLEKGDQIAKESQDLKEELVAAVEDVRKQGVWNKLINCLTAMAESFQNKCISDNVVKTTMSSTTLYL